MQFNILLMKFSIKYGGIRMNTNIKIYEDDNRLVIELAKDNLKETLTNNIIVGVLNSLKALGSVSEIPNLEPSTETKIEPLSENAKEFMDEGDVLVNTVGTTKQMPMTVKELVKTNPKLANWIVEKLADSKNAEIITQRNAIVTYIKKHPLN